jgi:MotA/TolQ/ExbB proton channel family
VRRTLIRTLLPLVLCVVPPLAAGLVAAAVPPLARDFYLSHITSLDSLIIALGLTLFLAQTLLALRALRWRGEGFDERPDSWLSNLAQAAEWFPLLGLIGTVAGILQTFSQVKEGTLPGRIIQLYAPAITATGSGLFMALINILPTWIVLVGRDLIRTLGGGPLTTDEVPAISKPARETPAPVRR